MDMRRAGLLTIVLGLGIAFQGHAAVTVWTGGANTSDYWSDPNAWTNGVPAAGDTAQFTTEGMLVRFDADGAIGTLELTDAVTGGQWLVLGEYALTADTLINNSDGGWLELATDVNAPSTGLAVRANAGGIVLGGAGWDYTETITLNGDLTVDGASDTYVYGPITGSGGLTKNGSGTLTLFAMEYMNDFQGDVILNDGLLVLDAVDGNPSANPTGNVLGSGDVYLYGGTLGLTGELMMEYNLVDPNQTFYVGGPDGNTVTIDAAHVDSQIAVRDGVSIDHYAAGIDPDGDGSSDIEITNNIVFGYNAPSGVVAADLVLGNATDGDELMIEFELADEDDPTSSTLTLLGNGVMHDLTVYTETDIESKITGAGGLRVTGDSTGFMALLNTENDFLGGLELNGGALLVNDSNQTGTSALGSGTFTINGDANDASKVIIAGEVTEIYYDGEWKDEDDNAWDGSIGTIEIGNAVEMQGSFTTGGFSDVEMDDWFDDDNDVPLAMIGSNLEISGATTLTGDTEIVVTTYETDAEDDVPNAALTALNVPENYFNLEISGAIGESGGSHTLTKSGAGTLTLSGTSSFTGGLDVNDGTVKLAVQDAITSAPLTIAENGTVEFEAAQTLAALNGSGTLNAYAHNLILGAGTSDFNGVFENLQDVFVGGGTHVIDANMSLQALQVSGGTLTLNGTTDYSASVTIGSGATVAFNEAVSFYYDTDGIANAGTLIGDTNSVGSIKIALDNNSTLKADADGLIASSVSVAANAAVTLDSTDGLLTLDDPTLGGNATFNQTGEQTASISNLDNQAGNTITLNSGTLYLTGEEMWASGGAGGGIVADANSTLIVDVLTNYIDDITGTGKIVKTTNAYASEDAYFDDLDSDGDANDLTLGNDTTIATAQGATLDIEKDVEIEDSATVAIAGESTVTVAADKSLSVENSATLDVDDASEMQVNGTLDVGENETLNVTGGGTVTVNSSNDTLDETATVAVSASTLKLGSSTATGNAQVALTDSTVEATAEEVTIKKASVSGNVTFSGNKVAVETLDTTSGAANLTTSDAGVDVDTLSGANAVTVAGGKVTLKGNSETFTETVAVSQNAAVELDPNAVLGGSVTLAGAGTINGTVKGAVTVDDPNASLGGTGSFQGGLTVTSGALAPGQSPGEITVSGGDFVLGAGATLNVEVDEDGNHDSIRVTDDSNANLVTGAKVVAVAIGDAQDGTYNIITLDGAGSIQVDGTNQVADANLADFIENTDLATISALVVDDTAKIVEMTVDFTSNTEYLLDTDSPTVQDFGRMLDSETFAASASDDLLDIVATAQASDDVAGSYAQMTNQLQTSASTMATGVTSSVNTGLSRRMQGARTVARETIARPTAGPLLASASPATVSTSSDRGWQGFVQGYGSWGDRDNEGDIVGYDYDTYGTLLGAETFISENTLVGGSIGYGRTGVDSDDSLSSMDIDSLSASLYGTWFNDDFYASVMLGYGYHDYDETRRLAFAGLNAKGDFEASTFSIAPEVGKLFRCKSFAIEPYAGLNYTHFSQDGYTEEGAGAANLTVSDDTDDNLFMELGTRLHKTWVFDDGSYMVPQLKLAWRHQFDDEGGTIVRLAGADTSFKTTEMDVVDDIFSIGAGLNWQIDKSKTLSAQYDAELGSGFSAHILQASMRIQF